MGRPNIYILGVGNLGKYVAHALMKQKAVPNTDIMPITLLLHRDDLVHNWKRAGCSIRRIADGVSDIAQGGCLVERVTPNSLAPEIKNLIVATKAHATVEALKPLRRRLSRYSNIIFLQNGMGTIERVNQHVFQNPATRPSYWAGICSAGITSSSPPEPFTFVHAGRGPLTVGLVDEDRDTPLPSSDHMIQRLIGAPELETQIVSRDEIRRAQVKKLVVNSVINPLTAILGCKNGDLLSTQAGLDLMDMLLSEAGPIARALLIDVLKQDPDVIKRDFSNDALRDSVHTVATKTAKNTSSMLQDVRAGRKTEIDYINKYLVSRGAELDLPRASHASIVRIISEPDEWLREQRSPEHWLRHICLRRDLVRPLL